MPKHRSTKSRTKQSTEYLKTCPTSKEGRNPETTKMTSTQFPHEKKQTCSFAKRTSQHLQYLHRKRHKLGISFDELIAQRGSTHPVTGLSDVTTSQYIVDSDDVLLVIFLKGALSGILVHYCWNRTSG